MKPNLFADRRGMSVVELALILPMLLILVMYSTEVTNSIMTRQRVSQLALQVADNASRIGAQEVLRNKPITEQQINDLFIGAQLQSGNLDIGRNGRIIVSQLIKNDDGNQEIEWQRCYGSAAYSSSYGRQGDGATNASVTGMGPATYKVTASTAVPVIFVEIGYTYRPVISARWAPDGVSNGKISEIASLVVRDERDTDKDPALAPNGIYNDEHVTPSTC